jgi:hypothetical protein
LLVVQIEQACHWPAFVFEFEFGDRHPALAGARPAEVERGFDLASRRVVHQAMQALDLRGTALDQHGTRRRGQRRSENLTGRAAVVTMPIELRHVATNRLDAHFVFEPMHDTLADRLQRLCPAPPFAAQPQRDHLPHEQAIGGVEVVGLQPHALGAVPQQRPSQRGQHRVRHTKLEFEFDH